MRVDNSLTARRAARRTLRAMLVPARKSPKTSQQTSATTFPKTYALRELVVPCAAAAAACVLVVAALLPSNDPGLAARIALERLAAQIDANVDAAWKSFARAERLELSQRVIALPEEPALARAHGVANRARVDAAPAPLGALLLDELERDLLCGAEPAALVDSARAALEAASGPAQRARALRASSSAALRARDALGARAALERLFAEASGAEARARTSELLLAWLEWSQHGTPAAPAWTDALVDAALDGTLALPLDELRIESAGPAAELVVSGDAEAAALAARLRRYVDGDRIAAAIERAQRDALRTAVSAWARGDMGVETDGATSIDTRVDTGAAASATTVELGAWSFAPRGDWFVAERASARANEPALVIARARDLALGFMSALGEPPNGFELAFDLPSATTPRIDFEGAPAQHVHELAPRVLRVALSVPDGASVAASAVRRAALLRAAFLVLAALCLVGGYATWRALVRERKLALLRTLFVANVSHELRTPLASILLLAENLADGRIASAEQAARYHASIRREALRLRELVDSVLDLSRLERGKPLAIERADVELSTWWHNCAADLRERAARHAVLLEVASESVRGRATIDGSALRRAVLNLMDNALKHSGSRRIEVAAHVRDDALHVDVRDHGRGIPARERERLFEAFERLDEGGASAPGAGLGLSIVRAIARAHAGSVSCTDAAPGACFTLSIPLCASIEAAHETPRDERAEPRASRDAGAAP